MDHGFRNVSDATYGLLGQLLETGAAVTVRNSPTREFLSRLTRLDCPRERYVFLADRNDDPIGQFAETMWVLAGRNDLPWLTRYRTRAPDFSDDGGLTWHGAYGVRLRHWQGGVDQVANVRQLLVTDRTSRRAVMSLFDPARDYRTSKDIPCNNWLAWTIRDDTLHLAVTLRSNDLVWGFSGINAFEWSVLHEMLAHWLDCRVGTASYFASSLHLYDHHFARAQRIVSRPLPKSPYAAGLKLAPFATGWEDFPAAFELWMELEERIAADPDRPLGAHGAVGDPLLDSGLTLVHLKWGSELWSEQRLRQELSGLPDNDFALAAMLYFNWKRPGAVKDLPHPLVRLFLGHGTAVSDRRSRFQNAIRLLHERKDRAYGAAWRRRGEKLSVLPNIARKVDRLDEFRRSGRALLGESILDTAVDLYIYAVKYLEFLKHGQPDTAASYDDHALFASFVDTDGFAGIGTDIPSAIVPVTDAFEALWPAVEKDADVVDRLANAKVLVSTASQLLGTLIETGPSTVDEFIRQETSHDAR